MKDTMIGNRIYLALPVGKVSGFEIHECMKSGSIPKYISVVPNPYTVEHGEAFLNYIKNTESDASNYQYGIFNKEDDKFIGMISLENVDEDNKKCELGYWVADEYRGKGLVKEASILLTKYAFSKLGMNKITAFVIKENTASISLLISLGFEIEGLLKDDVYNKGQFADRYAFALRKSERQQ